MKKKIKINNKFFIIIFLLIIFIFSFCSCFVTKTEKSDKPKEPFTIFKESLITASNSSYYLHKNKYNILIFEKKIDLNFMYKFLKDYSKNINQYVNINKLSRKKIEDEHIKIFIYESLDMPFNNQDSILKLFFDKNSMRLNDINIYFRLQKWGGLFDEPDLIFMNWNKSRYEDLSLELKFTILFHEYLHYLFYLRFNDYKLKKIFENPENASISYYYSFISEMLSYFNGECFLYFLKNEDSFKLTEDKVKAALRKVTENVSLSRAIKDPITISKNYGNNSIGVVLYFFNFARFLINYKDLDTFVNLMQYIFSGENADLDQIFEDFYGANLEQIFGLWKIQ